MRVLFASSEIFPLAKTGGLADVSAALPQALAALGIDVRLILPGYPRALAEATHKSVVAQIDDFPDAGPARLVSARLPDSGLPVWLVDCPHHFTRPGSLYRDANGQDWPDNADRFAYFDQIAARVALGLIVPKWQADIVHANDWHTGLIPLILRSAPTRPATVFTIHNLAYQGLFSADCLSRLGVPADSYSPEGMEFYGRISFLKAGIRYSDRLTTVSPCYAREILTTEFGCGLEGVLRERAADLRGILNGADYQVWNPASDPLLPANFDPPHLAGKRVCKSALQDELGLTRDPDAPLLISVSRISHQKMADILAEAIPAIAERGVQLAILGEGDRWLEEKLVAAASQYPGQVAIRIGYEEPSAHRLQAAGDILLLPARYEPCGLSQLYAMRYATLPLVSATGGLSDTVIDSNDETLRLGTATGFEFVGTSSEAMLSGIDRALAIYRQPIAWRQIQRRAMTRDFGWAGPAHEYLGLYRELMGATDPLPAFDPLRVEPAEAAAE
jgi:starch synthase